MHQPIDDEILVVHLVRGHYFSLQGVAAAIWSGLDSGLSLGELQASLAPRYDVAPGELAEAVRAFVGELVASALLVERADDGESAARQAPHVVAWQGEREPFQPPVLTRYWDIEELLAIDPIHEVDAAGWPPAVGTPSLASLASPSAALAARGTNDPDVALVSILRGGETMAASEGPAERPRDPADE